MVQVVAHRGANRQAIENTVEAFARAVELGADGIELDVRRTADGVLVVHHDALADRPAAQLADHVPTLAAALDACRGAWVDIEIKNSPHEPDFDPDDVVAEGVMAELAGREAGRWMISSFRLATIDRCRAISENVPTAWLVMAVDDAGIGRAVDGGHAAINPWQDTLTAGGVELARRAGLQVYTWTCNDPDRAVELAGWGVDGIVTDVPDVLLAALGD